MFALVNTGCWGKRLADLLELEKVIISPFYQDKKAFNTIEADIAGLVHTIILMSTIT